MLCQGGDDESLVGHTPRKAPSIQFDSKADALDVERAPVGVDDPQVEFESLFEQGATDHPYVHEIDVRRIETDRK